MTIKEAQEQIKSTSFVENADLFHKQSFKDRADTLALFMIIEALQNGYQLCKVDEIIKELEERKEELDFNETAGLIYERAYEFCIKIIKEACK